MSNIYDAIIVGGGPAGLSAAIYLSRAKFSVLVIEKEKFGGQITITDEIVNYPGVYKTSGKQLTQQMQKQAESFGAKFLLANVQEVNLNDKIKKIITDKGTFESIGIILATGSSPRKLGFKGEKEFQGRGVAYCATCDGEFFTGKDVFVIGGGFAAAEEAVFLTKYARKVHIIVREDDFTCAKTVADKAKQHPNIEISYNSEIVEVTGDQNPKKAIFKNNKTGVSWNYEADKDTFGIFVFAGYEPSTSLFKGTLALNETGNLIVDANQKTNIDGVYGAGDVCVKDLRQVVTAVSDGAIAATSLEKYIPEVVESLQIETLKSEVKKEEVVETSDNNDSAFISKEMQAQLRPILNTFTKKLVLKVEDDDSSLAKEMVSFVREFTALSDLVSYEIIKGNIASIHFYEGNEFKNVTFHAIPGGHEFNSFIIALYNAIGPKQKIDESVLQNIKSLTNKTNIKVIVSLSCTMCPEVVMATQRIALENKNIEAEMFDLSHFPTFKEKYNIMSVPAMIINDDKVVFGKKDISNIIEMIQ